MVWQDYCELLLLQLYVLDNQLQFKKLVHQMLGECLHAQYVCSFEVRVFFRLGGPFQHYEALVSFKEIRRLEPSL